MTAPNEKLEAGLKEFMVEATQAYAEDVMHVVTTGFDNAKIASFESAGFGVIDRWDESPDRRIYNGTESIFKDKELVWKSSYHGVVVPEADPEEVLAVYAEALKQPAPELPIRGPLRLEIGDNVYTLDSLRGTLAVARFAVTDQIRQNGKSLYEGYVVGGWMI